MCCGSVLLIALVGIIFKQEVLKQLLGAIHPVNAEFKRLIYTVEKASYVLGSENWADNFNTLQHLVKE